MNPRLFVVKGKHKKDLPTRNTVRFAIIDQDKPRKYPENFVCILPQHMNAANVDASIFGKTFKDKRMDLAKRLLTDALATEEDPRIRKEIKDRLRQLSPKQTWQPRRFP
ncbi:MAG: hypothetical protein NWF05_01650 [Candidatus Bathyarchaeota archaeon]|nr:hypothetical protein [Candidatus Bathyarchaeota archaeon]